MSSRLFRKVSLTRLESPEQLDQILRVTTPRSWMGLAALGALLATCLVWGFTGRINTSTQGDGVIVRRGGVLNVVTTETGMVGGISVKAGERIHANQVVATVAQPALSEKVRAIQKSIQDAQQEDQDVFRASKAEADLQLNALRRQRENTQRQIAELTEQVKIAEEQGKVQEQLAGKGLITRQQSLQARQHAVELKDQIASLDASLIQLDAQRLDLENTPHRQSVQLHDKVLALQQELASTTNQLGLAQNVTSPYGGEVLELEVFPGSAVTAGQPILSIQPDSESLQLLAYVPADLVKDVKRGAEVQISPTTIKREEFGFIKGHVEYISDFPATQAALMRNFENGLLVGALTASGPVNEVQIALAADGSTPSGFQWSTSRSPDIRLTSGTLCKVKIVTRQQRPATWVFPYIKGRLGLE